jgi:hypothetical protein
VARSKVFAMLGYESMALSFPPETLDSLLEEEMLSQRAPRFDDRDFAHTSRRQVYTMYWAFNCDGQLVCIGDGLTLEQLS